MYAETCVNLEEYFLLWVNISIEDFNTIQSRLRSLFNHQKLFDNEFQCEQYISHHISKDDRIVFIINQTNICRDFLLRIQQLRQVSSIYIRRFDENNSEKLQFDKVSGVYTDIDELISQIELDQDRRRTQDTDSALAFNVFNFDSNSADRSSLDLNAEFVHSLLIIDVLLRMKSIFIHLNQELIDLCQIAYKDNPIELQNIKKFVSTYTSNQALWWYTSNTFLYKILNKAFRVDNTHLLYLFRSFISDLHNQLKQCQCTSSIQVYRGQLITSDELDHLRSLIGRYISIKSFFSTSLDRGLAIFYLGTSNDSAMNLKRVLFEINADPETEGIKPFGKIALYSAFPSEQEVLFMPRSIFQILDVSFNGKNNIHIIQMVLCSEQRNHLKNIYEQNLRDYGGGRDSETNAMTLGNVLQRMGKYEDAEMFYRRQLNDLCVENGDDRLMSAYLFNIGEVLREKGDYDASMIWYQKSLDIDMKTLPKDHPNIGNTYNSIGIAQEKKCNYEDALDSYSIALKIALETFGWNNTRVALCLNNTGNAYQALDDYLMALDCHRIALMIREKNLPPDHHRLAASHNNIGVVYHRLGHFDLAYEHYKIALQINRKSLPPHHCDISIVVRNIALLRESQGNFKQALIEFEEEANRRRKYFQYNHTNSFEIDEDIERIRSKLM